MGLYYRSLIAQVKKDFESSQSSNFEEFLKANEAKYLVDFQTNESWFAFNMVELAKELNQSIPHYKKISDDFTEGNEY